MFSQRDPGSLSLFADLGDSIILVACTPGISCGQWVNWKEEYKLGPSERFGSVEGLFDENPIESEKGRWWWPLPSSSSPSPPGQPPGANQGRKWIGMNIFRRSSNSSPGFSSSNHPPDAKLVYQARRLDCSRLGNCIKVKPIPIDVCSQATKSSSELEAKYRAHPNWRPGHRTWFTPVHAKARLANMWFISILFVACFHLRKKVFSLTYGHHFMRSPNRQTCWRTGSNVPAWIC